MATRITLTLHRCTPTRLGLPPTLIQSGDRDVIFGDIAHMHMALIGAGVDSELEVSSKMFHVWPLFWHLLPEGRQALEGWRGSSATM